MLLDLYPATSIKSPSCVITKFLGQMHPADTVLMNKASPLISLIENIAIESCPLFDPNKNRPLG